METLSCSPLPKKLLRALALSGLFFVFGCGQRENSHSNLHPGEPFENFPERFSSTGSCAIDGVRNKGCGTVALAGSAVGGGFASSDMRVACRVTANAFVVTIADSLAPERAGLEVVASFRGLTAPPPRARVCKGVERADVPPQVRLKDSYCTIQVRIQDQVFTSTETSPCTVRVTGASPFRGTVACNTLYEGQDALTVEKETVFQCPDTAP